jgi:hypothetical protein
MTGVAELLSETAAVEMRSALAGSPQGYRHNSAKLCKDATGRTLMFHDTFQYLAVQILDHTLDLVFTFIAAPVTSAISVASTYTALQDKQSIGFLQLFTFPIETGRV